MSLHILRHKKWHVWNQDNEDQYTKDENEYMAQVEAEEKSSRMADMEKRIQKIKERKGSKSLRSIPFLVCFCVKDNGKSQRRNKTDGSHWELLQRSPFLRTKSTR